MNTKKSNSPILLYYFSFISWPQARASSYLSSRLPAVPNGQPSVQDVAQFLLRVAHPISVFAVSEWAKKYRKQSERYLGKIVGFYERSTLGSNFLATLFHDPSICIPRHC